MLGVTEQCDATGASACTAHCTLPIEASGASVSEAEPNDQTYQAGVPAGTVTGEIWPPGDVDLYPVKLEAAGTLSASLAPASSGGSCAALGPTVGLLDSELRLRAADGTLVASNDNGATGVCSALSVALAKGTYWLEVRASSRAPDQVFSYLLQSTTSP